MSLGNQSFFLRMLLSLNLKLKFIYRCGKNCSILQPGRIFSHVRPFYEPAVTDLDPQRSLHDLSRMLTARSQKGRTQPKIWPLYYKHMMIVNDNSRVINKLEASLTNDARVIIYDCHMFIVQATDVISNLNFVLKPLNEMYETAKCKLHVNRVNNISHPC